MKLPPSALFAGAGNNPPKGNPGSPGIANCLVERAFNSLKAVENDFNTNSNLKLQIITT